MIALTRISETASKITLGWTPVPGAIGYRFQSAAQAPKWSHTWDANRDRVTFGKADWYKVEALGMADAGAYPASEPPAGMPLLRIADFQGWGHVHLERISEYDDPTVGPVLRFDHSGGVGGSGNGVQLVDVDHICRWQPYPDMGIEIAGKLRFPRAGNPNGFYTGSGDWNAVAEWCPGSAGNPQFGVDATGGRQRLYARCYGEGLNRSERKGHGPDIVFDRWYDYRWVVRFGPNGLYQLWVDGQKYVEFAGEVENLDQHASDRGPWLQIGYYSNSSPPAMVELAQTRAIVTLVD